MGSESIPQKTLSGESVTRGLLYVSVRACV